MDAARIGVIVIASAALVSATSIGARQPGALDHQAGPARIASAAASSTVLSTLVSRDGQLVLLVLWRGGPGWMSRGGRASSQGGGSTSRTWVQLTRGELTVSVDVDHATGVARILEQLVSMKDQNVVLVDAVDTTPAVRTAHVDPAVTDDPDAVLAVLKRDPALVEFLQCELMRADRFLKGVLAARAGHPCGG